MKKKYTENLSQDEEDLLRIFENAGPEGLTECDSLKIFAVVQECRTAQGLLGMWERGILRVSLEGGCVVWKKR